MGRQARQLSSSGVYHVMFRGINHGHLFEDHHDFQYMTRVIREVKKIFDFEICAYCYMSNHVHLLLKEKKLGDISLFMKQLLVRYAMYFNHKYKRSGSLIHDRYKSIPIEVDEYVIPLVAYIHRNPVEAHMVDSVEKYPYSSYSEYIDASGRGITDTGLIGGMISKKEFEVLHQRPGDIDFDVKQSRKRSDQELLAMVKSLIGKLELFELAGLEKSQRNRLLRDFRKAGMSIREIERITGIPKGIIERCDRINGLR